MKILYRLTITFAVDDNLTPAEVNSKVEPIGKCTTKEIRNAFAKRAVGNMCGMFEVLIPVPKPVEPMGVDPIKN